MMMAMVALALPHPAQPFSSCASRLSILRHSSTHSLSGSCTAGHAILPKRVTSVRSRLDLHGRDGGARACLQMCAQGEAAPSSWERGGQDVGALTREEIERELEDLFASGVVQVEIGLNGDFI